MMLPFCFFGSLISKVLLLSAVSSPDRHGFFFYANNKFHWLRLSHLWRHHATAANLETNPRQTRLLLMSYAAERKRELGGGGGQRFSLMTNFPPISHARQRQADYVNTWVSFVSLWGNFHSSGGTPFISGRTQDAPSVSIRTVFS